MTTQTPEEAVLEVCQPSALGRRDADAANEAALAAVGLTTTPSAPGAALRERLLGSFGRGGRYGKFADRLARMFDMKVEDAAALAARLEDPSAWSPFLVPGVDVVPVEVGSKLSGAIALIARIPPGTRFPDHLHHGEETMFILDGGLREEGEGGAEAWRGDELVSSDGSEHAFVALEGTPCIAASIIEGVAEFR